MAGLAGGLADLVADAIEDRLAEICRESTRVVGVKTTESTDHLDEGLLNQVTGIDDAAGT